MQARTKEQKEFIEAITRELERLNEIRSGEKTELSDTLDLIHSIDSLISIYENPLYDNNFFDELRKIYQDPRSRNEALATAIRDKILEDLKQGDQQVEVNKERYDIHKERGTYFKNNPNDPNEDPRIELERMKQVEKWAGVSEKQPRRAPASDPIVPTQPKQSPPQHSSSAPQASNLQKLSVFSPPPTTPNTPKAARKSVKKINVVVAAVAPTKETLASLPIQANRAYVRFGNDLYYVSKAKQSCKKLKIDETALSKFDAAVKPREDARTLKSRELDVVAEIIGNKGHNYKKEDIRSNTPKL